MSSFLAAQQLAAWEAIAAYWTWHTSDDGRTALCECGHGILLLRDEHQVPYQYTDEQQLALIVLHLRTHHENLDPNG